MSTISKLQELDRLNKSIKQKSLEYKVNKEYGQETLKEFYKPILEVKTKEQEVIKEQHKEELDKIQNLQEELKKQQLIVPLIKSLKDHPGIIAVIQGKSDGSELTGKEQYILKQLQDIDDRTLLTLIDYFTKEPEKGADDVFGTPKARIALPSTSRESPVDPPKYTRIPPNLKSDKLGEWLVNNDLPTVQSTKLLLENGRDDRSGEEIKRGIADLVTILSTNGTPPNFSTKPWTSIKAADIEFYGQLGKIAGKKLKPKFSSSTPRSGTGVSTTINDLVKKLEILYAEKMAGNNNVLTEAAEILDTLRRNDVIDINMLKSISKRFV